MIWKKVGFKMEITVFGLVSNVSTADNQWTAIKNYMFPDSGVMALVDTSDFLYVYSEVISDHQLDGLPRIRFNYIHCAWEWTYLMDDRSLSYWLGFYEKRLGYYYSGPLDWAEDIQAYWDGKRDLAGSIETLSEMLTGKLDE